MENMKNKLNIKNTSELKNVSEILVNGIWYKIALNETYSDTEVVARNAYDYLDSGTYEIHVSEIEEVA